MHKKAFTLIELLVVIAIIGILAGILISSMVSATNSANDARRKADINQLVKAIQVIKINDGLLPVETNSNCKLGSTNSGENCSGIQAKLATQGITIPTNPSGGYYAYNRVSADDFTLASSMSDSSTYTYTSSASNYSSSTLTNGQCGTSDSTITLTSPSNTCSAGTASAVTTDSNTVLLMHMDGVDNGTTFSDQTNKTITRNGDAKTVTAIKKFGASGYFNGTTDYLSLADSDDWNFGNEATIDTWIYLTKPATNAFIVGQGGAGNINWALRIMSDNLIQMYYYNNAYLVDARATYTFSQNTWYHLAYTRSGSSQYLFLNGNALPLSTNVFGSFADISGNLFVASEYSHGASYFYGGYIDELRISKGIARWTTNFTPPNAQYYWWNWTCNGIGGGSTSACGADKY